MPDNFDRNSRYILVADSDVEDRFHTCMLLQRFGYNIFTAQTADEVVEFMTVAPPAAVVAGSGPAGAVLVNRISQDSRFFDIPLILLLSGPDPDLESRIRHKKYATSLTKPLDVNRFYQTIQAYVEKSPRRNLRISTRIPVRLEQEGRRYEGFATVLSEYGMFFRTLKPLPVNSIASAVMEIRDRLLRVEAVVLYSIPFEEGPFKEPGMGLKFAKISRTDRDLIAAYILQCIEEGILSRNPPRNRE